RHGVKWRPANRAWDRQSAHTDQDSYAPRHMRSRQQGPPGTDKDARAPELACVTTNRQGRSLYSFARDIPGWSSGMTGAFGAFNRGSNPRPGASSGFGT